MKVLIWIFACLVSANAFFFELGHFGDKSNKFRSQHPVAPPLPFQSHPAASAPIQIIKLIHQQSTAPLAPPSLSTLQSDASPRIIKVIHQQAPLQQANAHLQEAAATHVIRLIHLPASPNAVPPSSPAVPTQVIHVIHAHATSASNPGLIQTASAPVPKFSANPHNPSALSPMASVNSQSYSYPPPAKTVYNPQTSIPASLSAYSLPLSVQNNGPVPAEHVPELAYSPSVPKPHSLEAYIPPASEGQGQGSYGLPRTVVNIPASAYGPSAQKR